MCEKKLHKHAFARFCDGRMCEEVCRAITGRVPATVIRATDSLGIDLDGDQFTCVLSGEFPRQTCAQRCCRDRSCNDAMCSEVCHAMLCKRRCTRTEFTTVSAARISAWKFVGWVSAQPVSAIAMPTGRRCARTVCATSWGRLGGLVGEVGRVWCGLRSGEAVRVVRGGWSVG